MVVYQNKFKKYVGNKELPCALKWSFSTINLHTSTSSSCYKTKQHRFDVNNFDSFHNIPEKIQDRKKMLDGVWPGDGCENCKKNEYFNENSLRTEFNGLLEFSDEKQIDYLIPKELFNDPKNTKLTPKIIEVNFNNLCNMKCTYCGFHNSVLWEEEEKNNNKFFVDNIKGVFLEKNEYEKNVNNFFNWLEKNNKDLFALCILGGEPFLQKECFRVIDFFNDNPNKNINLLFYSNLKHNLNYFDRCLQKVNFLIETKKVNSVTICCSIDGWGKEQEYVRSGLKIKQWEQNFYKLILNYPKLKIRIHSTICNLTIKSYPLLVEKMIEYSKIRKKIEKSQPIKLTTMLLEGPDYFLLQNFPVSFFDKDFDRIFSLLESHENFKQNISEFKSYQRLVNFHDNNYNSNAIQSLKNHLTNLDSRRNTNWETTFPWLLEVNANKSFWEYNNFKYD